MSEQSQKVVTKGGRVLFCYTHVFAPHQAEKNGQKLGKPKYSVQILIRKDDTENVELLKAAVAAAKQEGLIKHWNGVIPEGYKSPIKDGDKSDLTKNPERAGCWFLNIGSNAFDKNNLPLPKPVVVGPNPQERIEDPAKFYSGCYGNVSFVVKPYGTGANNGITCYLQNIQKIKDGTPLGGGPGSPENDFGNAATGSASAADDFTF